MLILIAQTYQNALPDFKQLNLVLDPPLAYRGAFGWVLAIALIIALALGVYAFIAFFRTRKSLALGSKGSDVPWSGQAANTLWFSRVLRWLAVIMAYVAAKLAQYNLPQFASDQLRNETYRNVRIGFILAVIAVVVYGVGMLLRCVTHRTLVKGISATPAAVPYVRKQFFFHLLLSCGLQVLNLLGIWAVLNFIIQY